ncbi:MAG: V-type ATP synthase subunit E [Bacteroidales bacterium]|nr:V-type ATP synthase subunit E [Bacteroidales bacterium]MBR5780473.1 V-type ATP synthase subunit E [Bacteroidales bacterium]
MENNDNKLDILTKKIYEEGIEKAQQDASDILEKARKDAEYILREAEAKANSIVEKANNDSASLRQKTEAELSMSVKQAVAALKQQLTNLISNKVAVDMTKTAFKDDDFVRELMCKIIEKWNIEGNVSLNVLMNEKEKEEFEKYLLAKHKNLLNDNLSLVTNTGQKDGFVVQPKDGSYKITFSEKVFEEFFNAYIKEYSKKLLFS